MYVQGNLEDDKSQGVKRIQLGLSEGGQEKGGGGVGGGLDRG